MVTILMYPISEYIRWLLSSHQLEKSTLAGSRGIWNVTLLALGAAIESCRAIFAVLVWTSGTVVTIQVPAISWFANVWRLALLSVTRWLVTIIALVTLVEDQSTICLGSEILAAADRSPSVWAIQSVRHCQERNERQADQSHQGGWSHFVCSKIIVW
jgi:hypothetical protein